jgi:hypothetical protein
MLIWFVERKVVHVLKEARMMSKAFWDVAPCSIGVYRRFRGAY